MRILKSYKLSIEQMKRNILCFWGTQDSLTMIGWVHFYPVTKDSIINLLRSENMKKERKILVKKQSTDIFVLTQKWSEIPGFRGGLNLTAYLHPKCWTIEVCQKPLVRIHVEWTGFFDTIKVVPKFRTYTCASSISSVHMKPQSIALYVHSCASEMP